MESIFGSVGHTVFVTTTQLCYDSTKEAIEHTEMNGCG